MDKFNIATGYLSDTDLFSHILTISPNMDTAATAAIRIPTLSDGEDKLKKQLRLSPLHRWILSQYTKEASSMTTNTNNNQMVKKRVDLTQKRFGSLPLFKSDLSTFDYNPGSSTGVPVEEVQPRLRMLVQKEGELVIIPPATWHQVYHLEPSIALASQHFPALSPSLIGKNSGDGESALVTSHLTVVDHILDYVIMTSKQEKEEWKELVRSKDFLNSIDGVETLPIDAKARLLVKILLEKALKSRYGVNYGNELFQRLYENKTQ